MGDFNDKNLFFTLLILLMCVGIFYLNLATYKKYKNLENDSIRFYTMTIKVYIGYLISILGIVFSIYQLFKWLLEYVNKL